MRIETITLSGFRCFGPKPTTVALSPEITALVGPNAAGKTALLQALSKLFGVSHAQRIIQRSDFHLGPSDDPQNRDPKEMYLDVLIGLPELADGTATPESIAPSFRHMLVARKGDCPVCRLRLEARWEDNGMVEGGISQEIYWVHTLDEHPPDDKYHPLSLADRGLIQLYYTPASRDATGQIRATTGALASRLLRAIEWSSDTAEAVREASDSLRTAFEDEAAIAAISAALQASWSSLHDDVTDTNPRLSLMSRRFEEVVSKISVVFERGPDGHERGLDALSDGQQSLFYFALAAAVFELERSVVAKNVGGFRDDQLHIPPLTVFALEEPENHLSPYYLARIIRQVRSMTETGGAQAIVTSHSPAVLSRVEPFEVRYCRCDPVTRASTVKEIRMPPSDSEAAKFVRGAVLAYPELYFARFVLLVEGDSEWIVLPILAEALNILIDPAFVAIVPLGGRHVQHFWRLLRHLDIPYATLLDLDLGRTGGGFGRVKTAIKQLFKIGVSKTELLRLEDGSQLAEDQLKKMHTWEKADEIENLQGWVDSLVEHGVFFSSPLDIDLIMLEAYSHAYEAIIPKGGGPELTLEEAAKVVLGEKAPGLPLYRENYSEYPALFPAYRYHFMTHSKPATHLAALMHLEVEDIAENMPSILQDVLEHISKSLRRD